MPMPPAVQHSNTMQRQSTRMTGALSRRLSITACKAAARMAVVRPCLPAQCQGFCTHTAPVMQGAESLSGP
jgi:hypothetical protein